MPTKIEREPLLVIAKDKPPELQIYDAIGPSWAGMIDGKLVARELAKVPNGTKEIVVSINSPGGSVWEGMSIYNQLQKHSAKIRVEIDGLAASIASIIAMAGDTITIAQNANMMIHEASMVTWGDAGEHEKSAGLLRKINDQGIDTYAARATATREQLAEWVADETWFTAEEALAAGLVTAIDANKSATAVAIDPARTPFKHVPRSVVRQGEPLREAVADLSAGRDDLQAAIVEASGVCAESAGRLLKGDANGMTREQLAAAAGALDTSAERLLAAAETTGTVFAGEHEPEPEPATPWRANLAEREMRLADLAI